jgi:hypothetical protein
MELQALHRDLPLLKWCLHEARFFVIRHEFGWPTLLKGLFTQNVIFSVGCSVGCRMPQSHATPHRKSDLSYLLSHLTLEIAPDTENHCLCKHTLKWYTRHDFFCHPGMNLVGRHKIEVFLFLPHDKLSVAQHKIHVSCKQPFKAMMVPPVVDVMIAFFAIFGPKKLAFFLKNQFYDRKNVRKVDYRARIQNPVKVKSEEIMFLHSI